jgi:hypothetical protein
LTGASRSTGTYALTAFNLNEVPIEQGCYNWVEMN